MIYATADLHGYPLNDFKRLLDSVGFNDNDYLFILGDVIDRNGDGGIEMLRWMMLQPNIELILGNHEAMLLACDFLFDEITEDALNNLSQSQVGSLTDWMTNGAEPTLAALHELRKKNPEDLVDLLDYLREAPLYDTVETEGGDFLLVHSGLGNFSPGKPLHLYTPDELLWTRPAEDERYFDHVITVFGHTPTALYGTPSRMFKTPTWIDIDTGAGSGYAPMLLCLNNLEAHYMPVQ